MASMNDTKICFVCSQSVDESAYVNHVQMCCEAMDPNPTTKSSRKILVRKENRKYDNPTTNRYSDAASNSQLSPEIYKNTCFICTSSIAPGLTISHMMPCDWHHMVCISCLYKSMSEHIKLKSPPCCSTGVCDFQLSKYDIACLPIKSNMITDLLALVTTQRRPQCPRCLFYIEFQDMDTFQNHVASCSPEDMVPCQYCGCLFKFYESEEHSRYCQNTSEPQRKQAFIDFILTKLKYPFTPVQVRFYIEKVRKFGPHELVDELAKLDSGFPFVVPTIDCPVCMNSCPYDEIFVFGCDADHKLCYDCFEQLCTTQMNNHEVLTCGSCNYQLQDGDIRQLRVSRTRRREFHEYQTQKTFSNFVNNARGIIKCPNRGCKWVIEARNPEERFRVVCSACNHEFCSICNQQYHYRTDCRRVTELTQRWAVWCNTERENYLRIRAEQDAEYRAQLDLYEKQKAANAQRNAELFKKFNDLKKDEELKAKTCRLCPHCQRIVEHLGGCSLMVCGRNYHGGDQQSGCSKEFDWDEAKPYVPSYGSAPQLVRNHLPRPDDILVVHKGVKCDNCHQDVVGIRFDCINCPSLIYCEKCEQQSTLAHSEELRRLGKPQHVFQLISQLQRPHTHRKTSKRQ